MGQHPTISDGMQTENSGDVNSDEAGAVGDGQATVDKQLKRLRDILALDADYLSFLSSHGVDAMAFIEDEIKWNTVGLYTDNPKVSETSTPSGTTRSISMTNAMSGSNATGKVPEGKTTVINTSGAFFNSTYEGISLSTDRNKLAGGTSAAQLFILLHELGHNTNALNHDFGNQSAVDSNDKTLEDKCAKTVKAFRK